ncbi:uncharacterized protein LOC127531856 [Acanthochromis polyacanthus]|uniref:uncharacterized protein LOC127531856 n=1 Tax=Acanthochromis polyacanthus TaxID=80966 RepID=UPI0022341B00|nr:uncharacterized protein LOC127531856 [Acanthochromis polyacanthus]
MSGKKWCRYGKKYNKEWEKETSLKDWIRPQVGDSSKAFCRYCKCEIRAHHADLMQHAGTEKHKKNSALFSSMRLTDIGFTTSKQNETTKTNELKIATYIACHTSISAVDHLSELVGSTSTEKELKIHRTKCTALINNVIAPCMFRDLMSDIGDAQYSLVIDESTDITSVKQLCVVIRYFSVKRNKIVSTFLGMINLDGETAEAIASTLTSFLQSVGLDMKKCMGLGTDGCSVMVGKRNSVYTHLLQKNPNLQLLKCVCHSIQLCVSKAVETLPRNLEYLVSHSHNWFSHSALRRREYAKIYSLINPGEVPLILTQMSGTRWLSIHDCCSRILQQWDELKLHFQQSKDQQRCYDAEILHQMYSDPMNKLYLLFLMPFLQEFNRINKLFQQDRGNPFKMLECLLLFFRSLISRVVRPDKIPTSDEQLLAINFTDQTVLLPVGAICFGLTFTIALEEAKVESTSERNMKSRCRDFLVEACRQVQKRLPTNIQIWKSMTEFSLAVILSQAKQQLRSLSILKLYSGDLTALDTQYQAVTYHPWTNKEDTQAEAFWVEVLSYKDSSGDQAFKELALFALSLLAMPLSNADVERVFSQMNLVKSKLRNRMGQDTLSSILHIKYGLRRQGICCKDFIPSKEMLQRFNCHMYSVGGTSGSRETDANEDSDDGL